MNFTPEEIATQRAFFARAHPTGGYPLWSDITEWEHAARTTHADALTVIEQQRAEIERLRAAGDALAEYVELLARKGDDITTSELEAAIHAMANWKALKGGEK